MFPKESILPCLDQSRTLEHFKLKSGQQGSSVSTLCLLGCKAQDQSEREAKYSKSHALQNKNQSECMADCSCVYDNMHSVDCIFCNCLHSSYTKRHTQINVGILICMFCSLAFKKMLNYVKYQVAANLAYMRTVICWISLCTILTVCTVTQLQSWQYSK